MASTVILWLVIGPGLFFLQEQPNSFEIMVYAKNLGISYKLEI
jgi:hypothetical protein